MIFDTPFQTTLPSLSPTPSRRHTAESAAQSVKATHRSSHRRLSNLSRRHPERRVISLKCPFASNLARLYE